MPQDQKGLIPVLGIWFTLLCFIAVYTNGTGDSGDSVQHYLFSKYAFKYPELFLHHWAKPVFVLLSAPFAQFGFVGMKIFNCLLAVLTGYFTYQSSKRLQLKHPILALLFLFFAPLYFTLTFSGLTEPLFAFLLILPIYLILREKVLLSAIIISFLPFVRSEGLIIVGVFAFYFFIKKNYKLLPWLASGHVFYGLVGFIYYQDLLWVVNKIPYASLGSPYGSGEWYDFFIKINYTIGIPLYLLLIAGVVYIVVTFFKSKERKGRTSYQAELLLIYGSFAAFFVAHSAFWYLGIFNSMGLKRVLIGVMPLIAIIALNGFNLITSENLIKKKMARYILRGMLVVYVIGFPFTPNPAAVQWDTELTLSPDQIFINEIAEIVKKDYPGYKLYYSHPYVSSALNLDHFDTTLHADLINFHHGIDLPQKYLVIWDDWFSVIENGVTLETLRRNNELEQIGVYEDVQSKRKTRLVLLKRRAQ